MDYYYSFISSMLGVLTGFIALLVLLSFAAFVCTIVGYWNIFRKAGRPGWAAIIPFYNTYVLYDITWGSGIVAIAPIVIAILLFVVGGWVGTLLMILSFALTCVTAYKTALAFGKNIGFAVGLVLLVPIFVMILGMSKDIQYLGVPQDGFTYNDIRQKFGEFDERNKNMSYSNNTEGPKQQYETNDQNDPQ